MNFRLRKLIRIWSIIAAGYNLMRVAINPQNTANALALSDRLLGLGLFKVGVEHLKANPLTAKVLRHPYSIPQFDVDQMLKLPKNSLGWELANIMKENNLDPNFFRRDNPNVEGKVILDHIEQTHDIWHIILGFDTSVPGETGVLSFEFGQLRAPQTVPLMGGAIIRCLFTGLQNLPPIMEAIVKGWNLAKKWPPLFSVNWKEIMHIPVEDIRALLDQGIIPTAPKQSLPEMPESRSSLSL